MERIEQLPVSSLLKDEIFFKGIVTNVQHLETSNLRYNPCFLVCNCPLPNDQIESLSSFCVLQFYYDLRDGVRHENFPSLSFEPCTVLHLMNRAKRSLPIV